MKVDLNGKVAVVTGGGGILCSVMAKSLAEAGAKVAILDLKEEAAKKVADEIVKAGGKAIGVAANVLDLESLKKAEAIVKAELGACDILGTLLTTQVFAREMAEKGAGSIINISSMNAFTPLTKIPAYSGAKAAISNFTQWLAVHFSKVNIRVNAIAPGFFLTEQNRTLLTNPDGSLTARGNTILSHTPMGRFGTPDDLTGALLFLVDDSASSFINGVVLPVDGAFSAFSGV